MHLNELAKFMRTAGEKNRLRILCVIFHHKKICVSNIAKELNMSVAIVSHHLQIMARDNLLTPSQEGKCTYYQLLKNPFIYDLKKFICRYEQKYE